MTEDESDPARTCGKIKNDPRYAKVLSFAKAYMADHDGKSPSVTAVQMECGLGYPLAKRMLREVPGYQDPTTRIEIYENLIEESEQEEWPRLLPREEMILCRKDELYAKVGAYCRAYAAGHEGQMPSLLNIEFEFDIRYPRAKHLFQALKQDGYLYHD